MHGLGYCTACTLVGLCDRLYIRPRSCENWIWTNLFQTTSTQADSLSAVLCDGCMWWDEWPLSGCWQSIYCEVNRLSYFEDEPERGEPADRRLTKYEFVDYLHCFGAIARAMTDCLIKLHPFLEIVFLHHVLLAFDHRMLRCSHKNFPMFWWFLFHR